MGQVYVRSCSAETAHGRENEGVMFKAKLTGAEPIERFTALSETMWRSVREIRARLADPYEPARYYMRGAGPKSHARAERLEDTGRPA
jgi:hypothetical protein